MAAEKEAADRKDVLLGIQVTADFNEALKVAAAKVDRSVSSFVRYHVGRAMGMYDAELAEIEKEVA
jgi:hypothetical protein